MEKISGILPANARITSVDMKNSGSNRSGMPAFGRDVGLSSVDERAAQELAAASLNRHNELMSLRNSAHTKTVDEMARKFFDTRKAEYEKPELPTFSGGVDSSSTYEMNSEVSPFDRTKSIGSSEASDAVAGSTDSSDGGNEVTVAAGATADDDSPVLGKTLDVRV